MKWGVLGAANIAVRSVMPAIKAIKENELVAVASRSQLSADAAAAPFGIAGEGSYDALLDRKDIEAVYIPLPNSLHYEWVTRALEAGKHVLVEKSAFVTLEEAESAVALARSKGLAIVENFQFQHHSQHRAVRQLLAEGAIGQVRSIRASFGFPPFGGDANIRYRQELGGGALLDSGAYTLKATSFLFGSNFEVKAAHLTYNEQYGVDWFGGAFLVDEAQGLFSEVAWGFENFYQCNYEIWGSTGKLTATRAYTAKSDFKPSVILEQAGGTQELVLDADDHFNNMLLHFNRIVKEKSFDEELEKILVQARLIDGVQRLGGFR
ncbi:Gfo/Idh/MocA family oxidoreductase [Flaviaesturariibacter flavus]|uniref:Gfo/Idh/MocA family oxidoreductase n=1 Tax=Flaviaesturariibacter flavus TaxID=2502780 RepID=A0A4R1BB27_9BACT|nr:Gfo/Idh/MocA family oxidoreductase [Flaviaesturariibacter flavus]TCJ14191.1 Gfo/Idh/MocA family oxidoreductase [Flaviaesturariibacter flavus]